MIIIVEGMTEDSQETLYQKAKGREIGVIQSKPTFNEVKEIREALGRVRVTEEEIGTQLREWLGEGYSTVEKSNIIKEARKLKPRVSNLTKGVQENLYTQLYIILKREEQNIKSQGVIIYKGRPDKYELLILDILTKLGVLSVVENYKSQEPLEEIIAISIETYKGGKKEPIEDMLTRKTEDDIESRVVINEGLSIKSKDILNEVLQKLDSNTRKRQTKENKHLVYHIEICGVGEEENYTRLLTEFREELELNPRVFKILEQGIVNPTMLENKALDTKSVEDGSIIKDIISQYPAIANKETIKLVDKRIKTDIESKKLTGAILNNYTRVMSVWLKRVLDKFYKGASIEELPILVIWGELTEREEKFVELLTVIPMDILHLAPTQQQKFKFLDTAIYTIGVDKEILGGYPRNTRLYRQKTQTYEAKEEIKEMLYDGTMGLYQQMQFDRVKAKVMRATQEDIQVMWKVPMKLRTPFDTRYGIVEVSNFFVQYNGVPQDMTELEYKRKIQNYITEDTVILEGIQECVEMDRSVRRAVFRDKVDYGMIMKSEGYKYGIYSERTQQTIVEKAGELLELDWVVGQVQNLEYIILETIFNLPREIVQKQHAYTYTEEAPKLMYLGDASNVEGITIRESIVMMFLVLCGWDIMVVSPAGYRYTERYIQRDILDSIEIGPYNFGINWVEGDLKAKPGVPESESILGIIRNIFKK